jgi:hypothetical protein
MPMSGRSFARCEPSPRVRHQVGIAGIEGLPQFPFQERRQVPERDLFRLVSVALTRSSSSQRWSTSNKISASSLVSEIVTSVSGMSASCQRTHAHAADSVRLPRSRNETY